MKRVMILLGLVLAIWSPVEAYAAVSLTKSPDTEETAAVYENKAVYTTIDGVRYSMDGRSVLKDGVPLFSFSDKTFVGDGDIDLDESTMDTLLITDMASNDYNGHDVLYITGLVFHYNQGDYDQTSDYNDIGEIRIGEPYMVTFAYNTETTTRYPFTAYGNLYLAYTAQYDTLYAGAYNFDFIDGADPEASYETLYNYASEIVWPRLLVSAKEPDKLYMMIEGKRANSPRNKRNIQVYEADVALAADAVDSVPLEQAYIETDMFVKVGYHSGVPFTFNPQTVYMDETGLDLITLYNFYKSPADQWFGSALQFDFSVYTKPDYVRGFYKLFDQEAFPLE